MVDDDRAIGEWRATDENYRVEHRRANSRNPWSRYASGDVYRSLDERGLGGSYVSMSAAFSFAIRRSRSKPNSEYRIVTPTRVISYYQDGVAALVTRRHRARLSGIRAQTPRLIISV